MQLNLGEQLNAILSGLFTSESSAAGLKESQAGQDGLSFQQLFTQIKEELEQVLTDPQSESVAENLIPLIQQWDRALTQEFSGGADFNLAAPSAASDQPRSLLELAAPANLERFSQLTSSDAELLASQQPYIKTVAESGALADDGTEASHLLAEKFRKSDPAANHQDSQSALPQALEYPVDSATGPVVDGKQPPRQGLGQLGIRLIDKLKLDQLTLPASDLPLTALAAMASEIQQALDDSKAVELANTVNPAIDLTMADGDQTNNSDRFAATPLFAVAGQGDKAGREQSELPPAGATGSVPEGQGGLAARDPSMPPENLPPEGRDKAHSGPGSVSAQEPSIQRNVFEPVAFATQAIPGKNEVPQEKISVPLPQPLGTPEWNDELGERMIWMRGKSVQMAELRINPAHLGPVEVKIQVKEDQTHIQFASQHAAVRDAIDAALPRLREMFQAQQLTLPQVEVSHHGFSENRESSRDQSYPGSPTNQETRHEPMNPAVETDEPEYLEAGNRLLNLYV